MLSGALDSFLLAYKLPTLLRKVGSIFVPAHQSPSSSASSRFRCCFVTRIIASVTFFSLGLLTFVQNFCLQLHKDKSMLPQFFGSVKNYNEYFEWVKTLVAEGKTSGLEPTEARINFTALNLKRMERINKTYQPFEDFSTLVPQWTQRQVWVAIGEAWCGDCAQNYPAMAKIAALFGHKIDLRLISRDDNPEFMQKHATNGSLSIPKLIAFDSEGHELFNWGPRPKPAQELLFAWKKDPAGRSHDDFELELHTWYAKDKCKVLEKEIFDLMQKCL